MTTAEALEGITGTSEFELFAMSALRELEPEFAPIIHMGMNAQEKTITGPLDGFGRLVGANPRYGTVAITTSDKLKSKWLAESDKSFAELSADAGDLVKVARKAANIRDSTQRAEIRVALVTNREVGDDLVKAVDDYAILHNLEYTIISRGRLADYLDNRPNGNYHRAKLFGTLQTRLSWDLLRELGDESLDLFAQELQNQADAPWTREPYEDRLGYATSEKPLTYLLADSGRGKSMLSLRVARSVAASGGIALWCQPEIIASHFPIDRILLEILRALRPELDERAGKSALDFASDKQILLVVDDVNTLPDPVRFCERLTTRVAEFSKPTSGARGQQSTSPRAQQHFSVLVPIWASNARELVGGETPAHVSLVSMAAMDAEHAADLVTQIFSGHPKHTSRDEPTSIAAAMWNDPYIITMWGRVWDIGDPMPSVANVLQQYVDTLCRRVAKAGGMLPSEVAAALDSVNSYILRTRRLRPTISSLMAILNSAKQQAFRALLLNGRLCRPSSTSADATLVFQHDRLRDFVLSMSVVHGGHFTPPGDDTVRDPLFAEAFALAARFASPAALDDLVRANPLSAAIAVGESSPLDPGRKRVIETALTSWWNDLTNLASGANQAARLLASDWWANHATPLVSTLLKDEHDTSAYLAGSRLGIAESAVRLCSVHTLDAAATWRDSALAEGDRRRDSTIRSGLRHFFQAGLANDVFRNGAMWLAGYLQDASFIDMILACWRTVDDKTKALPAGVYAVSRTSTDLTRDMEELLTYWESIDDTRSDTGASPRYWATHRIPYSLSQSSNPDLVAWLRHVSSTRPELRRMTIEVAQYLFSPEAVIFLVESYEAAEHEGGASVRLQVWLDRDHGRRQPGEATLRTLRNLFLDRSMAPLRRKYAFQMWATSATLEDLPDLQAIDEQAVFDDMVLNARLTLADPTAVDILVEKLKQGTLIDWWLRFCTNYWEYDLVRGGFEACLDRHLRTFTPSEVIAPSDNADYAFAGVLNRIDPVETERIMLPRWRELSTRSQYLQAALAAGTRELTARFAETIKHAANPMRALEHVAVRFDESRGRQISFEALTPFLRYFDQSDLILIADEANRRSMSTWRSEHIDPLLDDVGRERVGDSDADWLRRYQRDYNRQHGIDSWLRVLEWEGYPPERAINIMRDWFLSAHEPAAFAAYIDVVRHNGLREDLERLEAERLPGHDVEISFTRYFVHRRTGYVSSDNLPV